MFTYTGDRVSHVDTSRHTTSFIAATALVSKQTVYISCVLLLLCHVPYVHAQSGVTVASAAELAEAVTNGASTIILQSRITGLPNERLSQTLQAGGKSKGPRYTDFPEVLFFRLLFPSLEIAVTSLDLKLHVERHKLPYWTLDDSSRPSNGRTDWIEGPQPSYSTYPAIDRWCFSAH